MLRNLHVAIHGLGLMGGSMALALKPFCANIYGVDREQNILDFAIDNHFVDYTSLYLSDIFGKIDLLILATPIYSIIETLHELSDYPRHKIILLDLGSTKQEICKCMDNLPEWIDPIGGHPMCGKEVSSIYNSEVGLFKQAPFALVPLERTSELAKQAALDIVQAIEAVPIWVNPVDHDRWTAATSHLPYLVSCALSSTTPKESFPLVGPGLRSMTRISGSSPQMMIDILRTNRNFILSKLKIFHETLDKLEFILRDQSDLELMEFINLSNAKYKDIPSPHLDMEPPGE